ncbi:hypothetical protein ESCO_003523 [Escovopsis weberi]|uniref:Uncharacterized protein n=1 Tax=Escovopsis weberi TaxID=150374 RepID=A0A0M8N0M4_ESCWE|nr:hypothetical protein ESCO_003523 [Escovopsis weberi]
MSRVTAPVAKLARALGSTPVHNAGAVLMPKYAELLRNRRITEHSDSRGLTTAHRPTPQPSLANRSKPLMQTFSSSASSSSAAATSTHLDATVLPALPVDVDVGAISFAAGLPRIPLLPDNYAAAHASPDADAPVFIPSASIVAANPDNVIPATPLSEVHSFAIDGIDLSFAHGAQPARPGETQHMIKDLWKGLVDDVLGAQPIPRTI